jgi:hypothetical protein
MIRLYRVEQLTGGLGYPVELPEAMEQVNARLRRLEAGDTLSVRPIEYQLDPNEPPGEVHTPQLERVWRDTITRFAEIGHMGVYACKDFSQHRYGNAVDWGASREAKDANRIRAYLSAVFKWSRQQGIDFENGDGGLPISEVIFRDKISTRLHDWTVRAYTGTFHAVHVHVSCYPLIPTDTPCGDVR